MDENRIDVLSASQVMERGLRFVGFPPAKQESMTHKQKCNEFHAHYGCKAIDISLIWYDLQTTTIPNIALTTEEKKHAGFKMFMAANFFLWAHTKNASLLSSRFGICKRHIHSKKFWKWIEKMSALSQDKIKWDERFDDQNFAFFFASIDGIDFKIWEKPSDRYNIDKGLCSFKSKHAAYRYLIVVSLWDSKCVFLHGPVKAGEVTDLDHWRLALKDRMRQMPAGKMLIADKGYQTSEVDEVGLFAYPNNRDEEDLRVFKTRARQRHETFNGRLVHYKILQDTFRFPAEKHEHVVRSVAVRVQYAMESGAPLFDV